VTDVEPAAAYAHALLTTLANVLEKKVERGDVDVPKYIDRLVPRVCNLFFYAAMADDKNLVMTDSRLVSVASRIVNVVVQTLPAQFVFMLNIS
jgi:DNA repair/transcription protein MET18/MMS19